MAVLVIRPDWIKSKPLHRLPMTIDILSNAGKQQNENILDRLCEVVKNHMRNRFIGLKSKNKEDFNMRSWKIGILGSRYGEMHVLQSFATFW